LQRIVTLPAFCEDFFDFFVYMYDSEAYLIQESLVALSTGFLQEEWMKQSPNISFEDFNTVHWWATALVAVAEDLRRR
jgi:hypothetical protein